MSRAWTWRNAILKSDLQATTKHVLMVISVHMNDMGEGCYPSTKTIAGLASLSERSVCTHIEIAEKAGWLVTAHHGFNGQGWARNEYRPAWPEGTESGAAPKGTERGAEGTEPDDKKALNDVQSIDTPIEHPKEPQKRKPTKASRREPARIRLADFLATSGGLPPVEWANWAYGQFGWDVERLNFEWDDFSDYWASSNAVGGGLKADWFATWRGHCRRFSKDSRRGGSAGGQSGRGFAAAFAASVAGRYGIPSAGSGIGGRQASGGTGTDVRDEGDRLPVGQLPF